MNTIAIDFESYYDKECSIKVLGLLGYFSHHAFDAYRVSAVGDEGTSFVGCPKTEFDWSIIEGNIVIAHNAQFDETLYLYGVEKKWWPYYKYDQWMCSADLAAYCGLPRSLKGATTTLYNLEVDKSTRDNMSGKRWEEMSEEFQKEVDEYALKDSELCLKLWQDLEGDWPEHERQISLTNRRCVQRGIPIDTELLLKQQKEIASRLFEAENCIPWINEFPPLSRKAFNEECHRVGLDPPASLALTDEDANKWIAENEGTYKWISAVRNYRRINSLKRKLESFEYATMGDDRYYGGILYHGAHTGRFSGSGGNLNLQNLPRGEMFGVDLRSLISPKKGKKLVVVDLSQIEVRTLCWLAEDKNTLDEIKDSDDIYEAFAVRFDKWDRSKGVLKEEDPSLRHLVKTMVLGCGYSASAKKFAMISNMEEAEAVKAVTLYRNKMNRVVSLWNKLQRQLHVAYSRGEDFTIELPSGRSLDYGKIKSVIQYSRRNYIALIAKGMKKVPVKLYGGLLTENASQALARDIFADILIRLEDKGLQTIFHVHDEVVIETSEKEAEDVLEAVIEEMRIPPDWIPDIPLDAEGKVVDRYEK
jgi:DNA polymerase